MGFKRGGFEMNEITPTQAHDIVNKEINVILKEFMEYPEDDVVRAELKGIISQEATEIEYNENLKDNILCDLCSEDFDKRLQALKISMADLKEKVE